MVQAMQGCEQESKRREERGEKAGEEEGALVTSDLDCEIGCSNSSSKCAVVGARQ
jgi:hypothetical protein